MIALVLCGSSPEIEEVLALLKKEFLFEKIEEQERSSSADVVTVMLHLSTKVPLPEEDISFFLMDRFPRVAAGICSSEKMPRWN